MFTDLKIFSIILLVSATFKLLANTTFQSCEKVGMPEARIILSQTVIYLASSPKSNAAYLAINQAMNTVKNQPNESVPLHLRNAPSALMKELDYGTDYKYAHDYEGNFITQEFLPKAHAGTVFYKPGNNPAEERIKQDQLQKWGDKYKL